MFFVFDGVNYCRSRFKKKRSTPSQGVAIKKNSVSSRTCHFYRLTSKPDRSKILISKLDDHKNYLDESTGFSDRLLY